MSGHQGQKWCCAASSLSHKKWVIRDLHNQHLYEKEWKSELKGE